MSETMAMVRPQAPTAKLAKYTGKTTSAAGFADFGPPSLGEDACRLQAGVERLNDAQRGTPAPLVGKPLTFRNAKPRKPCSDQTRMTVCRAPHSNIITTAAIASHHSQPI